MKGGTTADLPKRARTHCGVFASEGTVVEQGLMIAEAQLRDYQSRRGMSFAHQANSRNWPPSGTS
jgi:hypothetical protein